MDRNDFRTAREKYSQAPDYYDEKPIGMCKQCGSSVYEEDFMDEQGNLFCRSFCKEMYSIECLNDGEICDCEKPLTELHGQVLINKRDQVLCQNSRCFKVVLQTNKDSIVGKDFSILHHKGLKLIREEVKKCDCEKPCREYLQEPVKNSKGELLCSRCFGIIK